MIREPLLRYTYIACIVESDLLVLFFLEDLRNIVTISEEHWWNYTNGKTDVPRFADCARSSFYTGFYPTLKR